MGDAIGIGYFQFDNLVRNRVPFCLFSCAIDFSAMYKGQEMAHIRQHLQLIEGEQGILQITKSLAEMNFRKIDPLIIICASGERSQGLAEELCQEGYLNCYFVEGGYSQLLRSSQQ